jgi:HAD superfamily hydrolase (TIGR01490 family)
MEPAGSTPHQAAAFFDVDGTLAKTTIVHYYVYFKRKRMSPFWGRCWQTLYLLKCLCFLALDRIDRSRLNRVFYRSYARLPVDRIKEQAEGCHNFVIKPRQFEQAADCIAEHRNAGRRIVLVTGSIDFTVAPLAQELHVDDMLAARLVESNGWFTGELDGRPIVDEEKAVRVQRYAAENEIDLSQSYAYGDSISDLPMLEVVGFPQVVSPDRRLAAVALKRGWPVHRWLSRGDDGGGS